MIDDNESLRVSLCAMLEDEGFEICQAADGKEGVIVYKAEMPDLVITDIIMPEQEGVETISQIKRINPEQKIIAMSGGGQKIDANFCLLGVEIVGIQHVINKPFDSNEMLELIKLALQ